MTPINRRKKRGGKFKYLILILIVLFGVLNYLKVQPFHPFVFKTSVQVLKIKDTVLTPFSSFFDYFNSKKKLAEENESLKKEINNLKIDVISSQALKIQYQNLSGQIADSKEARIAKVLLKPPFSSFDNLVLFGEFNEDDLGREIFYENIVLGKIESIEEKSAIARLFSATNSIVTGQLKDGNQFEVFGKGTGRYEMILPKDVEIVKGDPVVYPFGQVVLLGVINEVVSTEDDLFNKAIFNIPIDFADINFVRIAEPKNILNN